MGNSFFIPDPSFDYEDGERTPLFRVFVEGQGAPRVNHMTYQNALDEAKRLAKSTMKKTFVVEIKTIVTPEVSFKVDDSYL